MRRIKLFRPSTRLPLHLRLIRYLAGTTLVCIVLLLGTTPIYATASIYLSSNTTSAGVSSTGLITANDLSGVTLGSSALINNNGDNYALWKWSKSVTSGVDIVTYTGTGVAHTIAHSLAATPAFIMIKRTDIAGNWKVASSLS